MPELNFHPANNKLKLLMEIGGEGGEGGRGGREGREGGEGGKRGRGGEGIGVMRGDEERYGG